MGHLVFELYIKMYDYHSTLILGQFIFILLENSFPCWNMWDGRHEKAIILIPG